MGQKGARKAGPPRWVLTPSLGRVAPGVPVLPSSTILLELPVSNAWAGLSACQPCSVSLPACPLDRASSPRLIRYRQRFPTAIHTQREFYLCTRLAAPQLLLLVPEVGSSSAGGPGLDRGLPLCCIQASSDALGLSVHPGLRKNKILYVCVSDAGLEFKIAPPLNYGLSPL